MSDVAGDPAVERTAELLRWLGRHIAPEERPAALEVAVLERHRVDRHLFSDVFELSFSCDPAGVHPYRFSYAFPGWPTDPGGVATALSSFCRPFGTYAEDACRTVLRAARSRAVAQLLFGFACDGAGSRRVKLYLQFHPHEARAAALLADTMLGGAMAHPDAPLHLLCLDLGASGLAGAKLYFLLPRLVLAALPEDVGPVPVVAALAALGVSELRDVLAIHRLSGPDAGPSRAVEVDFSLADNGLRWDDVRRLAPVAEHLATSALLTELMERFPVTVRRVSGSVGDNRKLNAYYVLEDPGP